MEEQWITHRVSLDTANQWSLPVIQASDPYLRTEITLRGGSTVYVNKTIKEIREIIDAQSASKYSGVSDDRINT